MRLQAVRPPQPRRRADPIGRAPVALCPPRCLAAGGCGPRHPRRRPAKGAADDRLTGDDGRAASVAAVRAFRGGLSGGRSGDPSRHDSGIDRCGAGTPPGRRLRLRSGRASLADRAGHVPGGAGDSRGAGRRVDTGRDAGRFRPDRGVARGLLLPSASRGVAGAARRGGARVEGVRHAGGDFRVRVGGVGHHPAAARPDRPSLCQTGRVSQHPLPPEDAMVATVFIHRREAHLSSALRAFADRAQQTRDLGATGSVDCCPVLALPLGLSLGESPANPAYCLGIATKIGNARGERGSRRT